MTGHVLVAPDKFKGSLTGLEAADALASGLRRGRGQVDVRTAAVADGGDGTVRAVLAAAGHGTGRYHLRHVRVTGPLGRLIDAEFALCGQTAVIELAAASGLARLRARDMDPLAASSAGVGEMMRAALNAGAATIVLALGGSACTDGGAGMLTALGAAILDRRGRAVPPGGGALTHVHTVSLTSLDPRLTGADIIVATDVDNPLLGDDGAARGYGAQKGARPHEVEILETALSRWSAVLATAVGRDQSHEPGAGAAGGVGLAALAALGGRRRSGAGMVLDLVGFDQQIENAQLVITGEGSLDAQTLRGKAPCAILHRAQLAGVPVLAVVGRCALTVRQTSQLGFDQVYSLTDLQPDPRRAMAEATGLLDAVGEGIATQWVNAP